MLSVEASLVIRLDIRQTKNKIMIPAYYKNIDNRDRTNRLKYI